MGDVGAQAHTDRREARRAWARSLGTDREGAATRELANAVRDYDEICAESDRRNR